MSFGPDASVQHAIQAMNPDAPPKHILNNEGMTSEEINRLIVQGNDGAFDPMRDLAARSAVPTAVSPQAPPDPRIPQYAPPQQQMAPPPQHMPPPQAPPPGTITPEMLMGQVASLQAERIAWQNERRTLAERAQQADKFEQWLESLTPDQIEAMVGGAPRPTDPTAPPPDPMFQELKRLQYRLDLRDRQDLETRRLTEQSLEAALITQKFGKAINIEELANYARSRGIPRLMDALYHAAGQMTIEAAQQQMVQPPPPHGYSAGPYYQQQTAPPPPPPQYYTPNPGYYTVQGQAPQGYPQQPQGVYYPPPAAPAPQEAVVMRPGPAAPSAGMDVPQYPNPARSPREAFGRLYNYMASKGLMR